MKTKTIAIIAAGNTQWLPVDSKQANFLLGIYVNCQGGGTYSYKVQHGYSDPSVDIIQTNNITRSTTTMTVVFPSGTDVDGESLPGHGLKVGDNMQVYGAGAGLDGSWDVAGVTDTHTVTATVLNSGATVAANGAKIRKVYVTDDAVIASGTTASKETSLVIPCYAVRVNAATVTSGQINLMVTQGVTG